jgi:lipopolysaccharide transport system ATP-binding protein
MSESPNEPRPASPAPSPAAPPPRAESDLAIRIHQLGKCYPMYNKPADRLKQALFLGRRKYYHDFWALKDVSFEVPRGRTVGIMGRNGSGKSTLLQIVAGTLSATCGTVEVRGRASALLELGAGFVPDLTGRENIYVYGTLTGLSRKEIDARFDAIAAFADIGEFIDQPVKIYSSGMFVRLAFSAAVNVDPDVLIIDEALAVGDARFSARCMNKINQFRESGVSILFVSHDMETVKRICDQALVLDRGQVVNRGVSVYSTNWYLAFLTNDFDLEKTRQIEREVAAQAPAPEAAPLGTPQAPPPVAPAAAAVAPPVVDCRIDRAQHPEFAYFRHGDGKARIVAAGLYDDQGQSLDYALVGQRVHCRFEVECYADLPYHIVGMHVRDNRGIDIIAINTFQERLSVPPVKTGDRLTYTFSIPIELKPGNYSISGTVAYDQQKMEWMDWIDNVLLFQIGRAHV